MPQHHCLGLGKGRSTLRVPSRKWTALPISCGEGKEWSKKSPTVLGNNV